MRVNRVGPTQTCAPKSIGWVPNLLSLEPDDIHFNDGQCHSKRLWREHFPSQPTGSNPEVCVKPDGSIRVDRLGLTQTYAQISYCVLECGTRFLFPFYLLLRSKQTFHYSIKSMKDAQQKSIDHSMFDRFVIPFFFSANESGRGLLLPNW